MTAERAPLRVVGRYALYNEIAAGGMATIHLGRLLGPVGFARTVAVKRLHPQFAKDPVFVSMFLDEARLAARVQHPNVVATIDVVATDGELFLIMDYVRGESLSKIVRALRKQQEVVPPRIAAAIICGFLHGLHAAHEAKNERGEPLELIHRDVSPQNVLVGADGIARVLDFGIAKAQGRIQVTRDGQIKGKLAYMPPEQLSGRQVSRAVDIYASAVVMWEMLTCERLFKGETESDTLAKIIREPVPAPSAFVPSLPKVFDAVLLKALSRDVAKRHATAKELALDIERCAGIASPTEVGEWVEEIVGPVLNAREEQIAEIESSSVGVNIPATTESSDSDVSLPSPKAIRAAIAGLPVDALPIGSGPPSSERESKGLAPPTPTVAMPTKSLNAARAKARAPDDGTGRTRTNTLLSLPLDRRLPIIASIAGLVVLFVVVGVVLAGKFSSAADATPPAPSTSVTASVASATPSPGGDPSSVPGSRRAIADPPPPEDIPPATASSEPAAASSVKAPAAAPSHVSKAVAPPPKPSAAPPPPPDKANCDPPYTIDATGRKKYKRECI